MHTYVYIQQNSNTAGVLGFKKKLKKIHSSVSLTQAHPHSPAAHRVHTPILCLGAWLPPWCITECAPKGRCQHGTPAHTTTSAFFLPYLPSQRSVASDQNGIHFIACVHLSAIPTRHNFHSTAVSYWGSFYLPVITPDTFFQQHKDHEDSWEWVVFLFLSWTEEKDGLFILDFLSQVALAVLLYCFLWQVTLNKQSCSFCCLGWHLLHPRLTASLGSFDVPGGCFSAPSSFRGTSGSLFHYVESRIRQTDVLVVQWWDRYRVCSVCSSLLLLPVKKKSKPGSSACCESIFYR